MDYDVAVIGAGTGGYPSAIRARQLGKKVVIFEHNLVGGTCLNYGCIPSKCLIHVANLYFNISRDKEGIFQGSGCKVNLQRFQEWKDKVIKRLQSGVKYLLEKTGVEIINATVLEIDYPKITFRTNTETRQITASNIVLAIGAQPIELPEIPFDRNLIITSKEALEMNEVPEEFAIVGGGVIGIELAFAYAKLGSKVSIIEIMPQILPGVDIDIAKTIENELKKLNASIYTNTSVEKIAKKISRKVNLHIATPKTEATSHIKIIKQIEVDKVLVSVGFKPNSDKIEIRPQLNVDSKKHFIVNKFQQTNHPNIYAVGDITGPPYLAYKASKQGIIAAEHISGMQPEPLDYSNIPVVIFSDPEIATVGYSENKLKSDGIKYTLSKFPLTALGKALSVNARTGFIKLLLSPENNKIYGFQIVSPEASNLITECALAIKHNLKLEDISSIPHPHPTFSELISEVTELAQSKSIHYIP